MAEADADAAMSAPHPSVDHSQPHSHPPHDQQQQPASPGGHDEDDSSLSDSSEDNHSHGHNSQHNHNPNDPNQPPPLPSSHSSPNSPNSSSSLSYIPSGHNKTKGGYRKVIRKDKQKHNESESRRRSRLRGQFMELRTAAKCSKKDRFSILNQALERFAYLEDRIQQLEKSKGIRSVLGGSGSGGGSGVSGGVGGTEGGGEGGEGDGGSMKAEGSAVGGMEAGTDGGGNVVGSPNSSFSAPSSVHRTNSAATGSSPTQPSDNSANGGYTSSFHSYDPSASSANNTNSNNPSSSNSSTANIKLLSDPLTNYPVLACLPTCFIALDGKFKDTNTAFCQLLGYNRDSLLQTTLFTVTHPNELMSTFAQLKRLLGGEVDCWEGPKLLVRGDGSVLSVHMTITCAKKYGKPDLYVGFFVPKSNSEPAGAQTVPSPQPQPHMQPTGMQPMYAATGPMRAPMPSHTVGTLPRTAHSPFSPLNSFPPAGYGDPSLTSPHGRPIGGGSFMPPSQANTITTAHAAGGGMSGQSQVMFGAAGGQQT